jgi:hypothetical protein
MSATCGTPAAYAAGCRCADCRTAIRAYQLERGAKWRASGLAVHGTRVAYLGGCRCDPCRDANAEYMGRYRSRRSSTPRPKLNLTSRSGGTSQRVGYAKGATLEELLEAW